jgi:hypothetical protein
MQVMQNKHRRSLAGTKPGPGIPRCRERPPRRSGHLETRRVSGGVPVTRSVSEGSLAMLHNLKKTPATNSRPNSLIHSHLHPFSPHAVMQVMHQLVGPSPPSRSSLNDSWPITPPANWLNTPQPEGNSPCRPATRHTGKTAVLHVAPADRNPHPAPPPGF